MLASVAAAPGHLYVRWIEPAIGELAAAGSLSARSISIPTTSRRAHFFPGQAATRRRRTTAPAPAPRRSAHPGVSDLRGHPATLDTWLMRQADRRRRPEP